MSKRKYRLNASFLAIGAFWPFGQPDQAFTGTVSSEKGKLHLASAPVYSMQDPAKAMADFLISFNSHDEFERTDSLCGFTSEGDCSLLSAALVSEGGLTDGLSGRRISDHQYRIWAAVMGLHLKSAEAPQVEHAALRFAEVSEWFPSAFGLNLGQEQRGITTRTTPLEVFRFHCASLGAEVTCNVHAQVPVKRRRAHIESIPIITIKPTRLESVEWFIDIAFRIENFLTLILGTSVNLKAAEFIMGGKSGWLVQKVKRQVEKINIQSWIRCNEQVLATALDRWLSEPQDKRPVEKTVLGALRKSSMFVETEFLSLAQALEGFHRIQIGNSRRDFKRRIEETYDMLSDGFALKLLGQKDVFARRVVHTRNFFTHLGLPAGTDVIQDGGELFGLNQRLHALLRCVMLLRLGVDEALLREPIQHQATRWALR